MKLNSESAVIDRSVGGSIVTRSVVGSPAGLFYGYVVDGMFNTEADFYTQDAEGNVIPVARPVDQNGNLRPISRDNIWIGDIKWKDLNGDGKITEDDRTFIGNPTPKFEFSINNTLTYKNFDLNVFIGGVYGNEIYNQLARDLEAPMSNMGLLKTVSNFAQIAMYDPALGENNIKNVYVANPGTLVPRVSTANVNSNNRLSDRFVEDGSYLRIRNISLGYKLPENLVKRAHIQSMRVYVNLQNIYTLTNYSGYDPEIGSRGQDALFSSIDYGRYPSPRIYTLGLNFNF